MGKGSARRPRRVSEEALDANWDETLGTPGQYDPADGWYQDHRGRWKKRYKAAAPVASPSRLRKGGGLKNG